MKKNMVTDDLADRVRKYLACHSNVREKKMFGRIAFMVNDKLCITAGAGRIMLRIDPAEHEKLLEMPGTSTVIMKNRAYKGFIYVDESVLTDNKTLRSWLDKALRFNKQKHLKQKPAGQTTKKR